MPQKKQDQCRNSYGKKCNIEKLIQMLSDALWHEHRIIKPAAAPRRNSVIFEHPFQFLLGYIIFFSIIPEFPHIITFLQSFIYGADKRINRRIYYIIFYACTPNDFFYAFNLYSDISAALLLEPTESACSS